VNAVAASNGLPLGFWNDEFVLGYMFGATGIFARIATDGSMSGPEIGETAIQVFSELSGSDGLAVAKRVGLLMQGQNADFMKGVSAADRIISVAYGLKDHEADPDVKLARSTVANANFPDFGGESTLDAKASSVLQMALFLDVVRERLG
jgi:hypothetical protein